MNSMMCVTCYRLHRGIQYTPFGVETIDIVDEENDDRLFEMILMIFTVYTLLTIVFVAIWKNSWKEPLDK